MKHKYRVDPKEFDELVAVAAKVFADCAAAMDVARDTLMVAAVTFGSFERFYCRTCGKFFARRELKEITGLFVPCPECGKGLIPARNVKFEDEKNGA